MNAICIRLLVLYTQADYLNINVNQWYSITDSIIRVSYFLGQRIKGQQHLFKVFNHKCCCFISIYHKQQKKSIHYSNCMKYLRKFLITLRPFSHTWGTYLRHPFTPYPIILPYPTLPHHHTPKERKDKQMCGDVILRKNDHSNNHVCVCV